MANLPRAEVELAIGERHSQVGTKEARLRQKVLVLVFNCVNIISSISSWNRGSTPEIERGCKVGGGLVM